MSNTQERIKKRQEYLKQKRWAYTNAGIAGGMALPFALVAACLLYVAVLCFSSDAIAIIVLGLILLAMSILFGGCCWILALCAREAHQKAKQLPFIPPITAETLPAEEVLVRGSEEPNREQSKVLLRGTEVNADTMPEDLLRASRGEE